MYNNSDNFLQFLDYLEEHSLSKGAPSPVYPELQEYWLLYMVSWILWVLSSKYPEPWCSEPWVSWTLSVLSPGCPETWVSWAMGVLSPGYPEFRVSWTLGVLSPGCPATWVYWTMGVLSPGYLEFRVSWTLGVLSPMCPEPQVSWDLGYSEPRVSLALGICLVVQLEGYWNFQYSVDNVYQTNKSTSRVFITV